MRLSHLSTLLALPHSLRQFVLLAATSLSVPVVAEQTPYISSVEYDAGYYGSYPIHQFNTAFQLQVPRVNILRQSKKCLTPKGADPNQARDYIFISPRGKVARPSPVILDEEGHVVWAVGPEWLIAYNFRVQRYKGQDVLTYWAGNDQVVGHGSGDYHILDSSYEEIALIHAGNGLTGDLHEFIIIEESNTALLTVYTIKPADLSSVGGPEDGHIWESIFQELDLETGDVLFEWAATQHYAFNDTLRQLHGAGTVENPWDWFHINSIEKDKWGNYLISARYTHSLTYIDGTNGNILWILGGERNEFKDLSGGKALKFAGQHDARWHNNYTVITLFDNSADYETHAAELSRGMRIAVDTESMSVDFLAQYIDPGHTLSESQGSLQVLPNDNVLVGWGFNGAFTEFAQDGTVLCDVHFQAQSSFGSGDVQSYRTYKQPWKGFPKTEPSVAVVGAELFVSWNGATEVRTWAFRMGSDMVDWQRFEVLLRVPKKGFETTVNRNRIEMRYIRVEGLDAQGQVLGSTGNIDMGEWHISLAWRLWNHQAWRSGWFWMPSVALIGLFLVFCGRRARRGVGGFRGVAGGRGGVSGSSVMNGIGTSGAEYVRIAPSWVESEWAELRSEGVRARSASQLRAADRRVA